MNVKGYCVFIAYIGLTVAVTVCVGGCCWPWSSSDGQSPRIIPPTTLSGDEATPDAIKVPKPIDLLLPRKIIIHPLKGAKELAGEKGAYAINVRIEALDAFDDTNKIFGTLRFELYALRAHNTDNKGIRITTWRVPVMDGKTSLLHWDDITRTYLFRLRLTEPLKPDEPFIMAVVFSSPFSPRLMAERTFEGL